MKAVLVLDEMPINCGECPLHTHVSFDYYYDESICMANGKEILDTREVHRMCPLKEIPERLHQHVIGGKPVFENEYINGWNGCLEEIER